MSSMKFDAQRTRTGCSHGFQGVRGVGVTHAMVQYICETRHRYETGVVMHHAQDSRFHHAPASSLQKQLASVFPDAVFKPWPMETHREAATRLCEEQARHKNRFVLLDDGGLHMRDVRHLMRTNRSRWGLTLLVNWRLLTQMDGERLRI